MLSLVIQLLLPTLALAAVCNTKPPIPIPSDPKGYQRFMSCLPDSVGVKNKFPFCNPKLPKE